MGHYLNSTRPSVEYSNAIAGQFFIDKTLLIAELFPMINTIDKYLCVTRPRRFGKSTNAQMIASFLGKKTAATPDFSNLKITQIPDYQQHLHAHNVIFLSLDIDLNRPTGEEFVNDIIQDLIVDLTAAYPDIQLNTNRPINKIFDQVYQETGERFIFIIDEWDYYCGQTYATAADKEYYLRFLRGLLKGQQYVEFAYMTGVKPIRNYSSDSALNMFEENLLTSSGKLGQYYGFTQLEVEELYSRYLKLNPESHDITLTDLEQWYNGYSTSKGERLYNPRSIVIALRKGELGSHWTPTGRQDEVYECVKYNPEDLWQDIDNLIQGKPVPASPTQLNQYSVTSTLKPGASRDQLLSAMVVLGFLTFDGISLRIPNKELRIEYINMALANKSLHRPHQRAKLSEKLMLALAEKDEIRIAQIIEEVHDLESPALTHNNEAELLLILRLALLNAEQSFNIHREPKAGKGYADLILEPDNKAGDGYIIELKVGDSPETALRQIKERGYQTFFSGSQGILRNHTGKVFAVAITYNREEKRHYCKIEQLQDRQFTA